MTDARDAERAVLDEMTDHLVAEFAGSIPARAVRAQVDAAREELRVQGIRAGLAEATATLARRRLADRLPAHV